MIIPGSKLQWQNLLSPPPEMIFELLNTRNQQKKERDISPPFIFDPEIILWRLAPMIELIGATSKLLLQILLWLKFDPSPLPL